MTCQSINPAECQPREEAATPPSSIPLVPGIPHSSDTEKCKAKAMRINKKARSSGTYAIVVVGGSWNRTEKKEICIYDNGYRRQQCFSLFHLTICFYTHTNHHKLKENSTKLISTR